MRPDEFIRVADVLSDPLLLVSGEGVIQAASRRAADRLQVARAAVRGRLLHDLVSNARSDVDEFLRLSARSSDGVVGSLTFSATGVTCRCDGARVVADAAGGDGLQILIRLPEHATSVGRFVALNEKIEQLGREVARRTQAETELREQRDLARFGRDVGAALVRSAELRTMLQTCAELIVEHLHGALARIWTLDEGSDVLKLRASAGLYTHIDGGHSRIKVGQFKIGRIVEDRMPHLTNAVLGDERVHDQDWARREGLVAFAGYPLKLEARTVGVMAMFARHELSPSTLDAMATVANSIALGIERKQVDAAVRRHASALQAADRRKDEFLAMLAHELRNPLAPIRSGLELIELETTDRETVGVMQQHVQHLTRLVDDLLDVSRIMRGRIELQRETVRLDHLVDRAVQAVHARGNAEGRRFSRSMPDAPLWVDADPVRLTQVITNLLSNAMKYTHEDGHVWLETAVDGDRAILRVRDDGIGIDADFLPEIFDLFAQATRSLDRSEGGLGIGLTLAHRLITLHGGEIGVRSEGPGTGSEFTIRLPLAAAPAETARQQVQDIDARQTLTILVVDDSVGSARILQRLLRRLGPYTVEVACDGHAAVAAALAHRPDVILLDIGLPGLDGYQVARQVRSAGLVDTQLVALTGYGTDDDRRRSREAGFDRHLVKPVGLDQLREVVALAAGSATSGRSVRS